MPLLLYRLVNAGYNTSMQKQLTIRIKNLHYGFIREDFLDQYVEGAEVSREHVDVTTSDTLQGIIIEHDVYNGKPVEMYIAVVQIETKDQDFKKQLAKLKKVLKQHVNMELNCRVPVEYVYGGIINR